MLGCVYSSEHCCLTGCRLRKTIDAEIGVDGDTVSMNKTAENRTDFRIYWIVGRWRLQSDTIYEKECEFHRPYDFISFSSSLTEVSSFLAFSRAVLYSGFAFSVKSDLAFASPASSESVAQRI